MRHTHLSRAAALAGAFALGCSEPASPTAPAASSAPSLDVERVTVAFGFGFGDERYTMVIGHTFEDMAAICAHGTPTYRPWDQLSVTRPTGREDYEESLKQLTRTRDIVFTVFEYAPFEFGNECPLLAAPYYEGSGRAFIEDNDVNLTHNGANAVSIHATGTVADQSGQQYHVVARLHHVLSSASTLDNFIYLQPLQVDIRLTPIGR